MLGEIAAWFTLSICAEEKMYSSSFYACISYGNFVLVFVCHNPVPIGAQVR